MTYNYSKSYPYKAWAVLILLTPVLICAYLLLKTDKKFVDNALIFIFLDVFYNILFCLPALIVSTILYRTFAGYLAEPFLVKTTFCLISMACLFVTFYLLNSLGLSTFYAICMVIGSYVFRVSDKEKVIDEYATAFDIKT